MIVQFKHELLTGKDCFVHDGFIPAMNQFVGALALFGCSALIVSSFRTTTVVPGAIVTPASHSNHLIGHAIDVNLYDKDGDLWTSKYLIEPKDEILDFINEVSKYGIRWGGKFSTPDPVHFDDGLNVIHPDMWISLYNSLHAK